MTMNRQRLIVMLAAFIFAISLTLINGAVTDLEAASSAKAITAFSFTNPAATGTINESAKTISVIVPYGTDVTALVATFTTTGVSVKVNGLAQQSGVNINNFTSPLPYVVWAEDNSIATYVVTVYLDSGAFRLPDTGQTACYNDSGTPIACTGTAQDGDYIVNPMSFTDNHDGTITDNVTGLLWQKCTLGLSGLDCASGTATLIDWYTATNASNACGSSTLVGLSWRLPTAYELRTIVDYGRKTLISYGVYGAAIDTNNFPNTQVNVYWASSTYANQPNDALYVHFRDGSTYFDYKGTAYYVRCVRGQKVGN